MENGNLNETEGTSREQVMVLMRPSYHGAMSTRRLIVRKRPEEYELTYGEVVCTLRRPELAKLERAFFKRWKMFSADEPQPVPLFIKATLAAYQDVHGRGVVADGELRSLSTDHARRLDLFMRVIQYKMGIANLPHSAETFLEVQKDSFIDELARMHGLIKVAEHVGEDLGTFLAKIRGHIEAKKHSPKVGRA